MSYNMSKGRTYTNPQTGQDNSATRSPGSQETAPYGGRDMEIDDQTERILEEKLGPVAYKLTDENGDVDLRKLTGPEAVRFMAAMGISVPAMGGMTRSTGG
jgi:hypothetical protein